MTEAARTLRAWWVEEGALPRAAMRERAESCEAAGFALSTPHDT